MDRVRSVDVDQHVEGALRMLTVHRGAAQVEVVGPEALNRARYPLEIVVTNNATGPHEVCPVQASVVDAFDAVHPLRLDLQVVFEHGDRLVRAEPGVATG